MVLPRVCVRFARINIRDPTIRKVCGGGRSGEALAILKQPPVVILGLLRIRRATKFVAALEGLGVILDPVPQSQ